MGWESIRGQDAALDLLRRDISSGRVAGAYLFYGPDGVGKAAAARLFARALQCAEEAPPCGRCPACAKTGANAHPDVVSVRPAAGARSIKVEAIREEVIWRAQQRPNEGLRQVFIIEDAHLLTLVSQNVLLKTLEEPGADTILILVTPNLHTLLPTVVSRCRRLRFQALSRADMAAILRDQLGDEADVDKRVSLSMGRLGVAVSADLEALSERREEAMRFLEELSAPMGRADEAALITLAVKRAGSGASGRSETILFLEMLRGLLRDILIAREAPGAIALWHDDVRPALAAMGARWGSVGLTRALERVGAAMRDVGVGNTNPPLTLETLVYSLRETVPAGR